EATTGSELQAHAGAASGAVPERPAVQRGALGERADADVRCSAHLAGARVRSEPWPRLRIGLRSFLVARIALHARAAHLLDHLLVRVWVSHRGALPRLPRYPHVTRGLGDRARAEASRCAPPVPRGRRPWALSDALS